VVGAAVLLAACGSSTSSPTTTTRSTSTSTSDSTAASSSPGGTGTVDSASVSPYGTILTSGSGHTLYRYTPDGAGPSTCTGSCAEAWPPVTVPAGTTRVAAGTGVTAADLGTVARSDGSLQVTYNRMPLYTYAGDTAAGQATGQGIGGQWYVIPTSGSGDAGGSTTTTTRAGSY
jgi:predicted lipoprotein with Yx(FWY)xxD motif